MKPAPGNNLFHTHILDSAVFLITGTIRYLYSNYGYTHSSLWPSYLYFLLSIHLFVPGNRKLAYVVFSNAVKMQRKRSELCVGETGCFTSALCYNMLSDLFVHLTCPSIVLTLYSENPF